MSTPKKATNDSSFLDEMNIDRDCLKNLSLNVTFLYFIALIPKYLEAVIKNRPKDIAKIPLLNKKFLLETFEVEGCDFSEFMLFNIYQALRYTTKQERCDTEKKCMKIIDLKNHQEAKEEIRKDIKEIFDAQFKRDLAWINGLEIKKNRLLKDSYYFERKLKEELHRPKKYSYDLEAHRIVMKILSTTSFAELLKVWRKGIKINDKYVKPSTVGSSATRLFVLALRCLHLKIPMRAVIVKILTTGTDMDGKVVWKNDTLKEGTVIANYIKLVDIFCNTFPEVCVKKINEVY